MEKLSSVKSVTGAGMVPGRCLEGSDQTWGSVHTGRSDQPEVVSLCGSEAASCAGQEVEGAFGGVRLRAGGQPPPVSAHYPLTGRLCRFFQSLSAAASSSSSSSSRSSLDS